MNVNIKGFHDERIEDAPFIGCLVIAKDCSRGCKGCFNQHLKDIPTLEIGVEDIIKRVRMNPFNEGIILGGLEWTEQPSEMLAVMYAAARNKLQIMLYTSMTQDDFMRRYYSNISELVQKTQLYIKYGQYIQNRPKVTQYGVTLASDNQYIVDYSLQS